MSSTAQLYAKHLVRWSDCQDCHLCDTRKHTVLLRGKLPADVLFCGEAPGESEDCLGQPFRGPAGRLLDQIIEEAWEAAESDARWAMTNLVACLPSAKVAANKSSALEDGSGWEPTKEEITACAGRLLEVIKIARPKLIVTLGKLAAKHTPIPPGRRVLHLIHPAAILRTQGTKDSAKRQSVVRLANALLIESQLT